MTPNINLIGIIVTAIIVGVLITTTIVLAFKNSKK